MSVTSAKYPGTAASVAAGSQTWINPDNIKASDASCATVQLIKNSDSYLLVGTNFGFSSSDIPAGSTINGIKLTIKKCTDNGGNAIYDNTLYCRLSGSNVGSNYASGSAWAVNSLTDKVYGGATDLWGWTPTQGNILDSSFGFALKVNGDGALTHNLSVDYFKVEIYYTPVPDAPTSVSATDNLTDKVQVTCTAGLGETGGNRFYRDGTDISGVVARSYTSDLLTGGTASAESEYNATYAAAKACDNDVTTRWNSNNSSVPTWWKYDLGAGNAKSVTKLTMIGYPGANPKDFILQGSNDNSAWTDIFTGMFTDTGNTDQGGGGIQTIIIPYNSNNTAYRYWRIYITSVYTLANCTAWEFQLFGLTASYTTYDDTTASPGTTYAYTVKSINDSGLSAASTADNGTRVASASNTSNFFQLF